MPPSVIKTSTSGSDDRWDDPVPDEVEPQLVQRLIYGHFLCHVFHIDYIFKKGVDTEQVKKTLLDQFKARSAKYPAEHNVGHLYEAGDTLRNFYELHDPTNTFNPGIGKQSKQKKHPSSSCNLSYSEKCVVMKRRG